MADPPPLALATELTDAEQRNVIQFFWNKNINEPEVFNTHYKSYLDYYERQREILDRGIKIPQKLMTRLSVKTHQDVRKVAERLARSRGEPLRMVRTHVATLLDGRPPEGPGGQNNGAPVANGQDNGVAEFAEGVQLSIDLVLRLWLTINVWSFNPKTKIGAAPRLTWSDPETSLVTFLGAQFHPAEPAESIRPEESQMTPHFTAKRLVSLCKVTIKLTDCLAHHLHYDTERKTVYIYQFQCCIYDHERSLGTAVTSSGNKSSVYPKALLQDTIKSLKLLFPRSRSTEKFCREQGITFYYQPPSNHRRELDLNQYTYWRSELQILHRLYAEREKTSLWQALTDEDNTLQRYTLWGVLIFNLLTFFFGVIASVLAGYTLQYARDTLYIARHPPMPPIVADTVTVTVTARQF